MILNYLKRIIGYLINNNNNNNNNILKMKINSYISH